MLPANKRLSRTDFSAVFKAGRRFHSEHFTIIYDASFTAAGSVVVSKKVAKLAVNRNRLRRRAYAVMAPLVGTSLLGATIVIYKVGSATVPRLSLASELALILAQIGKPR